jgi:outer membrane immunogenic protein
MSKIAATCVIAGALIVLGTSAQSADLKAKPILKAPPMPAFSWTGFYIGGNVGGVWGNSTMDPSINSTPFPVFTNTPGGGILLITPAQIASWPGTAATDATFLGGGQAGYNWQAGQFVFGVETDIDGTHLRESSTVTLSRTTISGTQTVTANYTAGVDWIATFRGRLGFAQDRYLFYVTGGLAVGGTSLNTAYGIVDPPGQFIAPAPLTAGSSAQLTGWTIGVGGEWAVTNDASLGIEYRHVDLGSHAFGIGWTDASLIPFVGPGSTNVKLTTDQVTARLNWRPWH